MFRSGPFEFALNFVKETLGTSFECIQKLVCRCESFHRGYVPLRGLGDIH